MVKSFPSEFHFLVSFQNLKTLAHEALLGCCHSIAVLSWTIQGSRENDHMETDHKEVSPSHILVHSTLSKPLFNSLVPRGNGSTPATLWTGRFQEPRAHTTSFLIDIADFVTVSETTYI